MTFLDVLCCITCMVQPYLTLIVLWSLFSGLGIAEVVPFLDQGFLFQWTPTDQPVPIPTTPGAGILQQVAPYHLDVYTSTFVVPFTIPVPDPTATTFDWAVPFVPGTQYQICMFDSLGTSGGCQAIYTVTTNTSFTNGTSPQCQNITFPPILEVEGLVAGSQISQFGWIDQCTDVSITPKNGTPPFTLTIAPALHPPYNITSNTMDPIVWTVSLGWGMPFFMSLVSSDGGAWQNGPMHAGENGPTTCLSPGSIPSSKARANATGAGIGGLLGGSLIATAAFLFLKWREAHHKPRGPAIDPFVDDRDKVIPSSESARAYPPLHHKSHPAQDYNLASSTDRTGSSSAPQLSTWLPAPTTSQVFVVHRDGGEVPVTVFTTGGAEVVELPPDYMDQSASGSVQPVEPPRSDTVIESKPNRRS